jgi:hypothetical protein
MVPVLECGPRIEFVFRRQLDELRTVCSRENVRFFHRVLIGTTNRFEKKAPRVPRRNGFEGVPRCAPSSRYRQSGVDRETTLIRRASRGLTVDVGAASSRDETKERKAR